MVIHRVGSEEKKFFELIWVFATLIKMRRAERASVLRFTREQKRRAREKDSFSFGATGIGGKARVGKNVSTLSWVWRKSWGFFLGTILDKI